MFQQRAACAGAHFDDDARLVDGGRAGRCDVHEIDGCRKLAARRDPEEHAARGERIGEKRIAIVRLVAGRAQERDRRLRFAVDQGGEIDDLETHRSRPPSRAAQCSGHPPAPLCARPRYRAGGRQTPAGSGRAAGSASKAYSPMRAWSRYFQFSSRRSGRPCETSRPRAASRRRAQAGPPPRAGRQPGMGLGDALDRARRVHAAAVPGRSQS